LGGREHLPQRRNGQPLIVGVGRQITERDDPNEPLVAVADDQPADLVLLHELGGRGDIVIFEAVDGSIGIASWPLAACEPRPTAVARMVLWRSVMTPSIRALAQTGHAPIVSASIFPSAASRVASEWKPSTSRVMASQVRQCRWDVAVDALRSLIGLRSYPRDN